MLLCCNDVLLVILFSEAVRKQKKDATDADITKAIGDHLVSAPGKINKRNLQPPKTN